MIKFYESKKGLSIARGIPFLLLVLFLGVTNVTAQTIRYVKPGALGTGADWSSASGDLQAIITASAANDQVWVAAGTYQQTAGQSFIMKEGVKIYGGFAANGAPTFTQRNFAVNTTILLGNGAPVVINNNNGLTNTAVIDGFTLTGGSTNSHGGGMRNVNSYPSVINCIFTNNIIVDWGGGIFNEGSGSTLVQNCLFYGNRAGGGGGAFDYRGATTRYVNVTFGTNRSDQNGGALHTHDNSNVTAVNSIFYGSTAGAGGAQLYSTSGSSITLNYSLVNNTAANVSGTFTANNNVAGDPLFLDAAAGNYKIDYASPARNAGNTSLFSNATNAKDLGSFPRVYSNTIDMGAYENQYPVPVSAQGVMYVSKGSTGSGTSWADAIGELATALKYAKAINDATPGKVREIWTAGGTYKPMYRANDLNSTNLTDSYNSFVLVNDVKVYGHFAGTETQVSQRELGNSTNNTILSGDLNGDDTYNNGQLGSNYNNNAYHVVVIAGIGTPTLDGFTITGGYASGSGSAISVNGQSVRMDRGSGLFVKNVQPIISNVIFKGNRDNFGGTIYNNDAASRYSNIIIASNTSEYSCAGLYQEGSGDPELINSTVTKNISSYGTLGLYTDRGSIYVRNSIIWGNIDEYTSFSNIFYYNNIVQGSYAYGDFDSGLGTDRGGNLDADPLFINADAGDFRLSGTSPANDTGDTSYFENAATAKDLAGNQRVIGGSIDMGAYENTSRFLYSPDSNGVMYVVKGANGNGSSWNNAVGEVSTAFKQAKNLNTTTAGTVQQIWVAKGVYKPLIRADSGSDTNSADNYNAFVLDEDINLYGHFAGTETEILQRELSNVTNATILSGDLGNNDVYNGDGYLTGNFNDNAYHVMVIAGAGAPHIDGFTIMGGYSKSARPDININGLTVRTDGGSGIWIHDSQPVISNTIVKGNKSDFMGTIFNENSSSQLYNILITANSNDTGTAGFENNGNQGTSDLTNITITNNHSGNTVSGIYIYGAARVNVRNSIMWGNTVNNEGNYGVGARFYNSIVQDVYHDGSFDSNFGEDMGGNYDTDPLFTNASAGDYTLQPQSPAAESGNSAFFPESSNNRDLAGNTRVIAGTIDMGVYEQQDPVIYTPDANGVLYVAKNSAGNGSSWSNAVGELSSALRLAAKLNNAVPGTVSQVWVAQGTYIPLFKAENINISNSNDRGNAFVLINNVSVYGHFTGTETAVSQRDLNNVSNTTILSGDLGNNDTIDGNGQLSSNYNDNALHVVIGAGTGTPLLDGFTVSGGYAGNNGQDLTVNNTNIYQNSGSAIYINNSQAVIANVITKGNRDNYGGTIFSENAAPKIVNTIISANTSEFNCAGFKHDGQNAIPQLLNVTIANNRSQTVSAVYAFQGTVFVANSIMWNNTAVNYGAIGGNVNYYNTIIEGFTGSDPLFTDPGTQNFTLQEGSPAIDAGNTGYFDTEITATDLAGNARVSDLSIDMGAYEKPVAECVVITTWNGSSWSNGVPTSVQYAAIIEGNFTSTGNLTACTLTVNSGDAVVSTGHTVTVKGAVQVADGALLTFENNAALLQTDSTVNTGNIVMNKDSNPLYRLDYTLWSSPVAGQNLLSFSENTNTGRFYEYRYGYSASANEGAGGNIEQYFLVDPAITTFEGAKGYLIRMPNGSTAPGYNAGNAPITFTGTFTGVPHNGSIAAVASVQGDRYTAVGNPYPSPISVVDFYNQNSNVLDGNSALYFWRKRNNAEVSSYATLTLAGYTANGGGGSDINVSEYYTGDNTNWLISQGQGFFVRTRNNPAATTINFNNGMRRPAAASMAFFRQSAQSATPSRLWLNLATGQGSYSQTAVAYLENATTGLDYGYDGQQLSDGGSVSLYSLAGGTSLSIQARPEFEASDVVLLGFKSTLPGQYTISLDHTEGVFAASQDIYLKDNLLGIMHDIKNAGYVFTTDAGIFDSRFEIVYTTAALGASGPEIKADSVIVYRDGTVLNITSGNDVINGITIYDIRGSKLYSKTGINAMQATITGLQAAQQVLIMEVDTNKGKISKRIIF